MLQLLVLARMLQCFPSRMAGSMNLWKMSSALVASCTVLAACSDNPVSAPDLSPSQAVSADNTVGRYLVVFRSNSVPATFTSDVEKLGGQVDGVMKNLGAAI